MDPDLMLLLARNLLRSYSISSPRYDKMPTNTATRETTVARRIPRRWPCTNWTTQELTLNARVAVWMFSGRQRSTIDKSGGKENNARHHPTPQPKPPTIPQSPHPPNASH